MSSAGAFVDVRAAEAISIEAGEASAAVVSIIVDAFRVSMARMSA